MNKCCLFSLFAFAYFAITMSSCQSESTIKMAQYAVNGQKIYNTHCKNCHGDKGEGLGTLYPPLTDTLFLNQYSDRLACIIKNGLNEEILVSGNTYKSQMPANNTLTDVDIAYVLTYISTNIAKQNKMYTLEEVQEDLKNCN